MKLDWLVSFEHCKHTADIWFLQIFNKTLTLYFKVSFVYGTTMLSTLVKIIWLHTEYLCEVNRIGMLLLLSLYYIINIR